MKVITDLTVTSRRPRAPWAPHALFGAGEQGVWFEPGPTTCFTDIVGTIPASVGDPVARINDRSGNGQHAIQTTAAARPVLRQTMGGLFYLEFDGVDDVLESPARLGNVDQATMGVAFSKDSTAAGYLINTSGATTQLSGMGLAVLALDPDNRFALGGADNPFTSALNQDTVFVASGDKVSGDLTYSLDGVPAPGSAGVASTSDPLRIGSRVGGVHYSGKVYGIVIVNREVSAGERTRTERYLADLSGVTLP